MEAPIKELKHILFNYRGKMKDKEYGVVCNWLIDTEIKQQIKNKKDEK